jgi:hypothetical protein
MRYIPGDFFQIPNKHALHKMSMHAQLVYFWICEKANYETGQCTVSIRTISKLSKTTARVIMTAIQELIQLGVISVVFGNRTMSNKYQLEIVDVVPSGNSSVSLGQQGVVPSGNVSILKDNKKIAEGKSSAANQPTVEKKKRTADEYIEKLLADKQDHVRLIGVYINIMKEDYDMSHLVTQEQVEEIMRANFRWAKTVAKFPKDAVNAAFSQVRRDSNYGTKFVWKLSTVAKQLTH